jgi:orotidine-5'-phosphate decarboxylase
MRFGARLRAAMDEHGPLCVGLDPHAALLSAWGLPDDVDGLAAFSSKVVSALGDRVAAIKPQSAFFERFGARGVAVLESTIRQLRQAGALVILDVKRGDIGSTAAAYADAYLDPASPMCADAITVSPYLGFGSLRPMLDKARENALGVFVLAFTSNPEGASVQRAVRGDGTTVGQGILDEISQVNAGVEPMGDIGAVIGTTIGEIGLTLTSFNGPILAPGLGAQGGRAEDLKMIFGENARAVLPSASREVLNAGPDAASLQAAADRLNEACAAALTVTT